jgi:hypothetical protein
MPGDAGSRTEAAVAGLYRAALAGAERWGEGASCAAAVLWKPWVVRSAVAWRRHRKIYIVLFSLVLIYIAGAAQHRTMIDIHQCGADHPRRVLCIGDADCSSRLC